MIFYFLIQDRFDVRILKKVVFYVYIKMVIFDLYPMKICFSPFLSLEIACFVWLCLNWNKGTQLLVVPHRVCCQMRHGRRRWTVSFFPKCRLQGSERQIGRPPRNRTPAAGKSNSNSLPRSAHLGKGKRSAGQRSDVIIWLRIRGILRKINPLAITLFSLI